MQAEPGVAVKLAEDVIKTMGICVVHICCEPMGDTALDRNLERVIGGGAEAAEVVDSRYIRKLSGIDQCWRRCVGGVGTRRSRIGKVWTFIEKVPSQLTDIADAQDGPSILLLEEQIELFEVRIGQIDLLCGE